MFAATFVHPSLVFLGVVRPKRPASLADRSSRSFILQFRLVSCHDKPQSFFRSPPDGRCRALPARWKLCHASYSLAFRLGRRNETLFSLCGTYDDLGSPVTTYLTEAYDVEKTILRGPSQGETLQHPKPID